MGPKTDVRYGAMLVRSGPEVVAMLLSLCVFASLKPLAHFARSSERGRISLLNLDASPFRATLLNLAPSPFRAPALVAADKTRIINCLNSDRRAQ